MSTTITNPYVYTPGANITAEVTEVVARGRFVKISGNRTAAGNLAVGLAGNGARAFGVAADDAAEGQLVRVARGGVVKVIAADSITAGDDVQVSSDAGAQTASDGVVVGLAVADADAGAIAEIAFYA